MYDVTQEDSFIAVKTWINSIQVGRHGRTYLSIRDLYTLYYFMKVSCTLAGSYAFCVCTSKMLVNVVQCNHLVPRITVKRLLHTSDFKPC